MAVAIGRAGVSHGGGSASTTKILCEESTGEQASGFESASTNQRILPGGTGLISVLSVVEPRTLKAPPSTEAHTLYSDAPSLRVQAKRTGETISLRSGGRRSR